MEYRDLSRDNRTCKDCIHFYITHDASFPYGCQCMGFTSRRYPHLEVEAATGEKCVGWEGRVNKSSTES